MSRGGRAGPAENKPGSVGKHEGAWGSSPRENSDGTPGFPRQGRGHAGHSRGQTWRSSHRPHLQAGVSAQHSRWGGVGGRTAELCLGVALLNRGANVGPEAAGVQLRPGC